MSAKELWLDVAGVRVGFRSSIDLEPILGPRFAPYLSEAGEPGGVVDIERGVISPVETTSVVASGDGVTIKVGSVDLRLSPDARSGRLKFKDPEDISAAVEALYSQLLLDQEGVLVRAWLVDYQGKGHVLFGSGSERAVGRRPDGARIRSRGVVAIRVVDGNVVADPTPFNGESLAGEPAGSTSAGSGAEQSGTVVSPLGAPCAALYRLDVFGPDRNDSLSPRESLRVLLEDLVFHDDDAEAAGRLLDMVLEVVAVVRVSRVIGKPIDNLWLSVG